MDLKFNNIFKNEIKRTSNHIYIFPHKLLRRYIAHYTVSIINNNKIPNYLNIIPDASGCLVFTYTGNNLISNAFGPTTKTTIVKNDLNISPMKFFVEFFPSGLALFLNEDQKNLNNLVIPLKLINNILYVSILEAFEKSENIDKFILMVDDIMVKFMDNKDVPNTLISSIQYSKKFKGILSVKEISLYENYSERHLNRVFNSYIGMSLKAFLKTLRINYCIQSMKNGTTNFTDLTYKSGFYDQSHFIHDFKSICNVTPKEYLNMMSDFYNEPFKL